MTLCNMQVFSLVCFMDGEFEGHFWGSLFCSITHGKVVKKNREHHGVLSELMCL